MNPAHFTETGSHKPNRKQEQMLTYFRNDAYLDAIVTDLVRDSYRQMASFHASGEACGRNVMGLWLDEVAEQLAVWITEVQDVLVENPAEAARCPKQLRQVAMIGTMFSSDWMNVAAHLIDDAIETYEPEADDE